MQIIQKKSFNNIDNNMYYEFSKDINPIYNINVFYDNNIAYYNNPNSNFNDNQKYNINSYNDSKDLSYSNSYAYPKSSVYNNSNVNDNIYGYNNSYGYPYNYNCNNIKINGIYGFIANKYGNNCFMNSSLQNILHCENFIDRIHSISDKNLFNKPLTREIKILISQIYKGANELDSGKIKQILSETEEKYKYDEQNDAHEFITIFLHRLLEELKGISPNDYKIEKYPKNELELKAFNNLENRFFLKYKSFLLNLFYGRLKIEYICQNGHIALIKFNNFNTLILPYPEKSNTIEDLLNLYQKEKFHNDTIFCNRCQMECKFAISTKIYNIPKYLILCLEDESIY